MMTDYREHECLSAYLEKFHPAALTSLERKIFVALQYHAEVNKLNVTDPAMGEDYRRHLGPRLDCQEVHAPDFSAEDFKRGVCERVLADEEFARSINRCPKCSAVTRTPLGRQCFWCGYCWHNR